MKWNKTWKYIDTVRNFVFGYIEDNVKKKYFFVYFDVQPQDTQAHTVSLFEYANRLTLRDGSTGLLVKYKDLHGKNIRALNL